MQGNKLRSAFRLLVLALGLLSAVFITQAQQAQPAPERKPARPLPAERSSILLHEARERFERPDELVAKLKLKDGDLVADIGAGLGYYSLRLAKPVAPHGAVFAVDIQQGMLDQLATRMKDTNVRNIYPVLGKEDDPMLPAGKMDWALLVDSYHEFGQPKVMLEKIKESLAPNGRVALLEYRAEWMPADFPFKLPRDHQMTAAEVLREWLPAGFELVEYHEWPAQHFFVFRKATSK